MVRNCSFRRKSKSMKMSSHEEHECFEMSQLVQDWSRKRAVCSREGRIWTLTSNSFISFQQIYVFSN